MTTHFGKKLKGPFYKIIHLRESLGSLFIMCFIRRLFSQTLLLFKMKTKCLGYFSDCKQPTSMRKELANYLLTYKIAATALKSALRF